MKIIKRNEFLPLPVGTLYSEYVRYAFGPLMIKGESGTATSVCDAIRCDDPEHGQKLLEDAETHGDSLEMDFSAAGPVGESELYAVWEGPDVLALIDRLVPQLHERLSEQHALLNRSARALEAWHEAHGIISPLYVPPGGDYSLRADIQAALR